MRMRRNLAGEVTRLLKILRWWLHMPDEERDPSKWSIAMEVSWNISWNTSAPRLASSGMSVDAAASIRPWWNATLARMGG
jgi:hypothetical protein